jgi:hypothetical protein
MPSDGEYPGPKGRLVPDEATQVADYGKPSLGGDVLGGGGPSVQVAKQRGLEGFIEHFERGAFTILRSTEDLAEVVRGVLPKSADQASPLPPYWTSTKRRCRSAP